LKPLFGALFFIFLVLGNFSCGGSSTSESGSLGGLGGGGIGPLADPGGITGGDTPPIGNTCDDENKRELDLEISLITNPHNNVVLENQFEPNNPLKIFTGIEHNQDPDGNPSEEQTLIQFEIFSGNTDVTFPFNNVIIRFYFLNEVIKNPSGPWPLVASFNQNTGINVENPACLLDPMSCLGVFDDQGEVTGIRGNFDFVDIPNGRPDWNGQILVGQVCDAEIEINGKIFSPISSNPIIFGIFPGFPP